MLRGLFVLGALPLTLVAVLPVAVKAASLSSSGNSTTIVLFTGFGENPSNSETGMNQLNTRLQEQFGGNHNSPFNSSVFSYSQEQEALSYINRFSDARSLGIVGYSFGGDSAFDLARQLPAVNLLVSIDSVGLSLGSSDEVLPGNVTKGINYYQSNPSLQDGSLIERLSEAAVTQLVEKDVEGAENINVETLFNDQTITHTSIDNDKRLHTLIAGNIDEFVIQSSQSVSRVSEPTLAFEEEETQAPVAIRGGNLAAAPAFAGGDIQASITIEDGNLAEAEAVPEPSSALGTLVFGLLGIGYVHKRRTKKTKK